MTTWDQVDDERLQQLFTPSCLLNSLFCLSVSVRTLAYFLSQSAAALEVLHTAGFREDTSGSDTMVLQRDDPGLLWLTCSLVEESLA
jgi:hypothetical protein